MIRRKFKKKNILEHKSTIIFVENKPYENKGILGKIFSSEGLFIAIFPILAYLLVFVTYTSFLSSFGIPFHFIEFNFSTIINIIVTASIILLSFNIIILGIIGNIPSKIRNQIPLRFSLLYIYFSTLWFISLIVYGTTKHAPIIWFLFFIFFIFPVIVGPIIILVASMIAKNKESKKELIKNYFIESFYKLDRNAGIWINILGGIRNSVFILIYLGLLVAGFAQGKLSARTQEYFFVAKITPECVVLYNSAEHIICSPFNRKEKEVQPAYRVLYYQDNQSVEYRQENIGPLHLQPTLTPTPKLTFTPTVKNSPLPTLTPTELPVLTATP